MLSQEFIEKSKHDVLGIRFTIGEYTFQPLNIVFERFLRAVPMHRHSEGCYEIHYIPYGKGYVILDGVRHPLSGDSLYMTGPEVDHEQQIDPEDPMAEYCIYLYVSRARGDRHDEENDIAQRFIQTKLWIGKDRENLLQVMQQLFQELDRRQRGYRVSAESLIKQCIVAMVRNYETENSRAQAGAQTASHFDSKALIMDESFLYEYNTLTLQQLSSRLSLSIRQTERMIQNQYHQTFRQKKAAARMHAAAAMLVSSELSLAQIAERLGFSSSEHFSAAFRKYYQISPGKYRRQCMTQVDARR